jgi:hypothetical protein
MSDYYEWQPSEGDEDAYDDVTVNDVIFGNQPDTYAIELMFSGVEAGEDSKAWQDFEAYMWDVYGIDIDQEWDWGDFREWYDS